MAKYEEIYRHYSWWNRPSTLLKSKNDTIRTSLRFSVLIRKHLISRKSDHINLGLIPIGNDNV